ncbi:MAG: aminotransferase class V-fold PLP-dependent enzyme [Clostridiales bacterium]|nr:aminotransferase class V-fold PLP-dependent enzyme [Clostridiales bacterium]
MIYLDNAATTFPKPKCVAAEMKRCIQKYCGNPGRSSHTLSLAAAMKIYECRCEIASMFGSNSPENVVFTYNTTYALNMAIKSLIKPGAHVLISDLEHNSVFRPVHKLTKAERISYDIFPTHNGNKEKILAGITSLIKKETSMLVCTHASNICGIVLPIEEIGALCRANNITFIVDAAQSAGLYDIDIKKMNIDVLCAPGHKALYGPQGVGFLLAADNLRFDSFIEGGSGMNSLDREMPDYLPERMEGGTLSTPCIAGLCEGIKTVKNLGPDMIRQKEAALAKKAAEMLQNIKGLTLYAPDHLDTGTLSFNIKEKKGGDIASRLNTAGICVRSGFHCSPLAHATLNTGDDGAVRLSIGWFNKERDIEKLYKTLKDII